MLDLSELKPYLDLVLQHKLAAAVSLAVASGLAAQVAVRLLNLLPLGWWYGILRTGAAAVSAAGSRRFTKPLWHPLEEWFEAFLGKSVDAIREGLDSDDTPAEGGGAASTPQGIDPSPPPTPSLELQADQEPPLRTGTWADGAPGTPAPPSAPPAAKGD